MKTYKAGVIGCGFIGKAHLDTFKGLANVDIQALADNNTGALKECSKMYAVDKTYTDYEEMLRKEGLDIVSVCTPHYLHCEQTIAALEEGAHVICEKPMAMGLGEADAMLNAAEKASRELTVISPRRYSSYYRKAKEMIENGAVGDFKHIEGGIFSSLLTADNLPEGGDWFRDYRRSGGGLLTYIGPHLFCISRFMAGDVDWVFANVERNLGLEVEDWASSYIHFKSGVNAIIDHSTVTGYNSLHFNYRGSDGVIHVTQMLHARGGQEVAVAEKLVHQSVKTSWDAYPEIDTCEELKIENPKDVWIETVTDFINSIETGETPVASGEDGRASLEIIMASYESQLQGKKVKLPLKKKTNPLDELIEKGLI